MPAISLQGYNPILTPIGEGRTIQDISFSEAIRHALKASEALNRPYWVWMDHYGTWNYTGSDPGMAPPYWIAYKGSVEYVSIAGRVTLEK